MAERIEDKLLREGHQARASKQRLIDNKENVAKNMSRGNYQTSKSR